MAPPVQPCMVLIFVAQWFDAQYVHTQCSCSRAESCKNMVSTMLWGAGQHLTGTGPQGLIPCTKWLQGELLHTPPSYGHQWAPESNTRRLQTPALCNTFHHTTLLTLHRLLLGNAARPACYCFPAPGSQNMLRGPHPKQHAVLLCTASDMASSSDLFLSLSICHLSLCLPPSGKAQLASRLRTTTWGTHPHL